MVPINITQAIIPEENRPDSLTGSMKKGDIKRGKEISGIRRKF